MGDPADRAVVVVPTYNERPSIGELSDRLFAATDRVDLLVVDDSSPDGTATAVRELQRDDERIHLIERPKKLGLGTAYLAGFAWALERGYGAVVEMDADLSHDPADVARLLEALDDADLVVGSRYVPGGRIPNWGLLRRALSRAGNLYARVLLGLATRDATSGFRAYRATVLWGPTLEGVASEGYAFQIEMVRRIERAGGRVTEIPITFVERHEGRSKMSRRIVLEALVRVTRWGLQDRLARLRRRRAERP
ncbi:MAG: polyprenol monophosphomannose synthase [Actinomycetota bacterium]